MFHRLRFECMSRMNESNEPGRAKKGKVRRLTWDESGFTQDKSGPRRALVGEFSRRPPPPPEAFAGFSLGRDQLSSVRPMPMVPPKLKTPRIWLNSLGGGGGSNSLPTKIKLQNLICGVKSPLLRPKGPWFVPWGGALTRLTGS